MTLATHFSRTVVCLGALGLGLAACTEIQPVAAPPAPPAVSVVTLVPESRPLIRELPGRITPTRIAEVRARVSGIVVERPFAQGADVKAGDLLYRIDPVPFEVELQAQEAAFAKAEAVFVQAKQQADRIQTLATGKTASQAQLEIAIATLKQAEADVAARRADVRRAKLNLEYAAVRAPINGRVGRALVTEGALVGQNEATHLTTVQYIGTVYADFTQSVGELIELRQLLEKGDIDKVEAARVWLKLEDGRIYPHAGRLLFSEAAVDQSTGQVKLRGEFSNPTGELLPGMYVRVQIEQGIDSDSLAVPQQAIQRNGAGVSEVYLVDENDTAQVRPVRVGPVVEDQWLVLEGLKSGDRVVVEGFQKISVGAKVAPSPWKAPKAQSASAGPWQRQATKASAPVTTR